MPGISGEKGNKGDAGDSGANVSKLSVHCCQVCVLILKGTAGPPGSPGYNGTKVSYNVKVLRGITYNCFRETAVVLAQLECLVNQESMEQWGHLESMALK